MVELIAPQEQTRVVKTGIVGRHDYEKLVKDCSTLDEALDIVTTGNVAGSPEAYYAYDDRGGCVGAP